MATLKEIREQNPGAYDDLSDKQLADALHGKYYSDMPRAAFYRRVGLPSQAVGGATATATPTAPRQQAKPAKPGKRSTMLDQIGAYAQAATEQIPFLDEAAAKVVSLATGVPYKEVRSVQKDLADSDRKERPLARNAGGVSGFVATVAAPGGAYVGGARTFGGAVLRSAQVGAGYGALAGAGAADDGLANRIKGGAKGAAIGAATGAAVPVVVRGAQAVPQVAKRAASGISEAGSRVARQLGREAPEAVVTPSVTQKAEEFVARMAAAQGITPQKLLNDPALLAGKPVTAAEAMGRTGMGQLTAIGRRSGQTPDALEAMLAARADEAGARIVDDFAGVAKIDPATVADDFAAMTDALRKSASPAYAAAYDNTIELTPELSSLMQRPAVKKAMRRAYEIAREEGVNPETIGLRWENIADDTDMVFMGAAPDEPSAAVRRAMEGVSSGRVRGGGGNQGLTLAQFLSSRGGIADNGGELSAMDLVRRFTSRGSGGRFESGKALSLEDAAQIAQDAGYFPERVISEGADNYGRISAQDLIDALRAEAAGTKVRRAMPGTDGPAPGAVADEAAERLYRYGDSGTPPVDESAYIGGPRDLPENIAPVYQEQPTMQAWDYVKRGMDDVLEAYRDPTTRKLNLDTLGRATVGTQQQLRSELVTQNPAYGKALAKGGEPLRLEQAWRDAPGLMNARVSERVFLQRFDKLSASEKQAFMGGFANDLFERARAGRLRPKEFRNPAFNAKLSKMLGPKKAAEFKNLLEQELRIARGGRMSPGTNSVTEEVRQASQELDRGTGFMADLQRRLDVGQSPWTAVPATVTNALVSPVAGFVRGYQTPLNQATRDEVGRLLMLPPDEMARVLLSRPAPPPQSNALLGAGTPAAANYFASRR